MVFRGSPQQGSGSGARTNWPVRVLGWSLVVATVVLAAAQQSVAWPRRFAVVAPGLYRSGELTPAQLARLQKEYGLRRVVSLLNPAAPESLREREAAAALGEEWVNVPLPGNGASSAAQRRSILDHLLEPDAGPTLVHCAAGVNRTGLAVALYRLQHDGWTVEQALAEMRRLGFEDLPQHENLRQALREAQSRPCGADAGVAP